MSTTPFSEALSSLTDRGLRRLLGARAFLRGADYVRRGAVSQLAIADAAATGHVKGSEPDPYAVVPAGKSSEASDTNASARASAPTASRPIPASVLDDEPVNHGGCSAAGEPTTGAVEQALGAVALLASALGLRRRSKREPDVAQRDEA